MAAFTYDVECYPNFFGLSFKNTFDKSIDVFTSEPGIGNSLSLVWDRFNPTDPNGTFLSFNGRGYDDLMIKHLLETEDPALLYQKSKSIIEGPRARYQPPVFDHPEIIDLNALTGAIGGLKTIGMKLGYHTLQELPYPPGTELTFEQMQEVMAYNIHDLNITEMLYDKLAHAIELRRNLAKRYGLGNATSNKDAWFGENVIKAALKQMGINAKYPTRRTEWTFRGSDIINAHLIYRSPILEKVSQAIKSTVFDCKVVEDGNNSKSLVTSANKLPSFDLNGVTYKVAKGGLHSKDRPSDISSNDEFEILDIDVASYYPNLMINAKVHPATINQQAFTGVLKDITEERLRLKAAGDRNADGLKIAINSIFGKLGSPWSFLFDPQEATKVTINGQLMLLCLIDLMSDNCTVMSANTDGVMVWIKRSDIEPVKKLVSAFGETFSLSFEYQTYRRVIRRDINNYVAIDYDGKRKGRGALAQDENLMKKPVHPIVIKAALAAMLDGVDPEDYVRGHRHMFDFLNMFTCKNDWHMEHERKVIGKVARWYVSTSGSELTKVKTAADGARTVARLPFATSAKLCPNLPADGELPDDIDYTFYTQEAYDLWAAIKAEPSSLNTLPEKWLTTEQKAKVEVARERRAPASDDIRKHITPDLILRLEESRFKQREFSQIMRELWIGVIPKRNSLLLAAKLLTEGSDSPIVKNDKEILSIVDHIMSTVPYMKPDTHEDIAKWATEFAADKVKPVKASKKYSYYYNTWADNSLIDPEWVRKYVEASEKLDAKDDVVRADDDEELEYSDKQLHLLMATVLKIAERMRKYNVSADLVAIIDNLSGKAGFQTLDAMGYSLTDMFPADLTFRSATCADGKTYALIKDLCENPRNVIISVPTVRLMNQISADIGKKTRIGVTPIYSDQTFNISPFDDSDELVKNENVSVTVTAQLAKFLEADDGNPRVAIITHEGLKQNDWSKTNWSGFDLIVDEVMDTFHVFGRNYCNHAAEVKEMIAVKEKTKANANYYELEITETGRTKLDGELDDFEKEMRGTLETLANPNLKVYVKRTDWDMMHATDKVLFVRALHPGITTHFRSVLFMADEFERSNMKLHWERMFGVNWICDGWRTERRRNLALNKRARIIYFSQSRNSKSRYTKEDNDLIKRLVKYVEGKAYDAKNPCLITCNANAITDVQKLGRVYESVTRTEMDTKTGLPVTRNVNYASLHYVPPKVLGLNEFEAMTSCAFFCAMNPSNEERTFTELVTKINPDEFVRYRELNPLFQFVMRTALRDFNSVDPVDVYVWGRDQADYLAERFDGALEVSPADLDVSAHEPKKTGRAFEPGSTAAKKPEGAQSNADRMKKMRQKKRETKTRIQTMARDAVL